LKKNTLGNHGKTDRFQHVPKINRSAQKHGMQVCLKWLILKSLLGTIKKKNRFSSKEKAFHFAQISKLIKSPALRANSSYYAHLSTGINVLLMFCEDQDSG
jgi:hypothetical protein